MKESIAIAVVAGGIAWALFYRRPKWVQSTYAVLSSYFSKPVQVITAPVDLTTTPEEMGTEVVETVVN